MKLLEQLQKLMPLAANATEGPWAFAPNGDYDGWSMIREADSANYHQIGADACDFASVGHITDAAFIAAARNLLTPENLTLLVAALVGSVAAAPIAEATAETMRWIECEIVRIEAENEAMYKTAREEDVAACRYNSVRLHTLKTIRQRLGSDNATC